MNSNTTMPCTRAYIEMMRGRREDYCCKKCNWFGHMVYQCRQREILEKRKRKSMCRANCHNSELNSKLSPAFKDLLNNLMDYNMTKAINRMGQVTILCK